MSTMYITRMLAFYHSSINSAIILCRYLCCCVVFLSGIPFMNEVKEGSIYRHYKGDLYQVIKIGYHTEIKDIKCLEDIDDTVKMVIYKPIEAHPKLGEVWWVRPYSMFIET